SILYPFLIIIFFFQAEDGIRDRNVTGVQTCALPISDGGPQALVVFPPLLTAKAVPRPGRPAPGGIPAGGWRAEVVAPHGLVDTRSEERRVGKECRFRWMGENDK